MPEEAGIADRRSSPRHQADGPVKFWWPDQRATPVGATLVDISRGGFRARHDCRGLSGGQVVAFELSGARGLARVVWTRVLGDSVESGFTLLAED